MRSQVPKNRVDIPIMDAPALPPPLPRKKSKWKAVLCFFAACFVAVLTGCILKKSPLAGHQQELGAIEALSALRYPEQKEKAKPACTDKGYKLVEFFGGFKPTSFNAVSVKSNPQFSDVEMFRDSAEGKTRIHIRLVKDNGWKFDDVYLNELDGKPCNQWVSYVCEHPIAFALQFHSEDILKSSKEVLDTAKTGLEVYQLIKNLNEGERR